MSIKSRPQINASTSSLWRRFRIACAGVVAVEFVILAPMFLLVSLSILEVTLISVTKASLRTGLTDTARLVRTGQGQCLTDGQAIEQICSSTYAPNCESRIELDRERFPTGLAGASVVAGSFNELLADEVVLVRVTYPWRVVTPILRPFYGEDGGSHIVQESFVFKNEGFQRATC